MANTTSATSSASTSGESVAYTGIDPLTGTLGKTVINTGVVSKIAGIAARDVPGVYALGGGAARAFGAIRDAISATDLSQGVSVEVGETQVAADISIVAEYPMPLQKVADDVRSAVVDAIETLVGLQVTEVNVTVNDVHLPSDDTDAQAEVRVQ
ncbi:Asp23/Gls24 family envelope stress response protein [Herbiconiux daphne]|uniref:Asp23/Gls24 family envelope stress response protein n=1 Tax=Herbiconiux daphne TaxID=2970914 RepID=A0ABT2H3T2_9MICO|nr:Asp23/Gls24 family envelope stress response protein [Herbiconiux daphne]MCS5734588.1 Asp23/Gls24 family envelope stress response protein [Herbiconiux daphne]